MFIPGGLRPTSRNAEQDLGPLDLKGFAEKVPAWQVTTAAHRSRSEALHSAASLAPLLGRDEELNALSQCWLEAKNGKGRVVLLVGEPGIGKSRLVATLMDRRLSGEISPALLLLLATTSGHPGLPYWAICGRQGSWDRDLAEVARPRLSEPGQEHLLEAFASQLAEVAARGQCYPVRGRVALD